MSFVENLQNYKNLINDLIERAEDFVELKRNDKFRSKYPNAYFGKVFYDTDNRECIIIKDTFENWKYYVGLEYCEQSSFEIIGKYVLISENEERISDLFELFDEMLEEQQDKE